ncbi:MAG: hypothetical protein SGJ04_00150 [Bacteroidota bacterium]|nr:hypothetical protein [Bacteroidota bacterium]
MKYILLTIVLLTITLTNTGSKNLGYDKNLVDIASTKYNGNKYETIMMSRKGERVKAKYFAAKDVNNNSVYQRYKQWAVGKKIILVSSGTYMDNSFSPVGITIDNGVIVNKSLENFDGLVIVYATGGIAVSNIKDGNLSINCDGGNKTYDVKKPYDRINFMNCAVEVGATVFQTHLLVFKNDIKVGQSNSSQTQRERRFLAACKDENGVVHHFVINSPGNCSLYECTKRVKELLINGKDMEEVVFMINLDTGAQDVFKVYDADGSENTLIKGTQDLSIAANLLVYYYE